jgi:hypothetical protein
MLQRIGTNVVSAVGPRRVVGPPKDAAWCRDSTTELQLIEEMLEKEGQGPPPSHQAKGLPKLSNNSEATPNLIIFLMSVFYMQTEKFS